MEMTEIWEDIQRTNAMESLSERISESVFVPSILRIVVWARSRVEWWAFSTLATLGIGNKHKHI
jgi:hypothetical protein